MKSIMLLKQNRAREGMAVSIPFLILISLLLGGERASRAEYNAEGAYSIKAAFLYNFAKFAEWPSSAFNHFSDPLVICVLGADPFGNALGELEGEPVGGRIIEVQRARTIEELGRCHILFISNTLTADARGICRALSKRPILTVSDIERFAQLGGMIGLTIVDKRIRFDINLRAAEHAGLKLNPQLLRLATIVESNL
ncbi:MAG: YfiR family protein [Desulfobacterota bacterium]|nr:YfiR family protein [Thermodesulfobacteriota bacterium]